MKHINPNQLSIFDFVLDHTEPPPAPSEIIAEPLPQTAASPLKDGNRCPYKIPTVDEIMKLIDRSSCTVGKSKLISDTFACGALAISSLADLTQYAAHCFMQASDIDIRCVHMTYLQLALAGVPAIVCHQNSLTNEIWSVWKTPAFIFQYHRFYKYDINLPKEKTA